MEHLRKKIGEHEREKRSAQDAEWAELDQLCWMAWEGGVEEEEEPSKGNDVMSEMKARVDQLDLSIGALAQSDLSK